MKQVIVTDKAISDIEKGKKWYNKKQENLGGKFSDYVFDCFEEIQLRPLIYPNKHRYTRELYIKKYPYLIIYSIEEKYIFILRVFPCKTNPKKKYKQ